MFVLAVASACAAPPDFDERTSQIEGASTVVSLTFDDTLADQYQVGSMAEARGMRAVFYINSPRVGTAGYMTRSEVVDLQTRGHEIAGHTLTHQNLAQITANQVRDQVCNDRVALLDEGYAVTSFAYPFGSDNTTVQQIVEDCNYNSARDVGGLRSTTCTTCPWANAIPPSNLFQIRTYNSVGRTTTLAMMQQQVINAEQNGGGYVPMVFHHVCNGCSEDSVSPALLASFLDWLATRAPATQVGTVQEVIGGDVLPGVSFPPETSTTNLIRNPSLETDADGNQVPDCWQRGSFGTNTATYSLVSDASDGARAQLINVTSFSSGGRRLVTAQDSGTCAPAITPGRSYTMTAFYKSTVQPRFSVYYRNASGAWVWFAQSPLLPTSSTYRQATYTTPPMPTGATAISLGLSIFQVGTITMDEYTLVEAGAPPEVDTIVPLLSISCNGKTCSTSPYTSPVTVTLAASDDSGIDEVRYTTNGGDPATGTLYTGPFTISATATVRATAVDTEGNAMAQLARLTITPPPDTTPPTLSILCNGSACATTAYPGPVTITLPASDAGGIREVRYTTNGSDPVTGTLYTGAFTLPASATVRATAVDNAGNRTSQTATVTITAPDTTPPSLSIACNGTACSTATYPSPVTVTLTATDAGSGIREVRYTTDGSDPVNGTLYTGAFTLAASATVRATAVDAAGNRTSQTATITIATQQDTTPPTLSIACNGADCSTAAYPSSVTVALTASDAGSGILEVRYTTDGTDPVNGMLYTGAFTLAASATVRATAVDNAGNRTSLQQAITIAAQQDTTPPSLAITCNGAACLTTAYPSAVTVALTASDPGSGILEVRYTTDGSDPVNGTLYTGPFTLAASATVRATAVDNAGNRTSQTATVTISAAPTNLLQNPSLEIDANANQIPDCWNRGGYGTNTAVYTLVADAFDGAVAQRLDITSWTSGGRRLNSFQDAGACAPAATAGRRYTVTAYYKATTQPRVSIYVRNASGSWVWFAESALLPISSTYVQATYTTPALPTGTTAISIGVSIFGVGSLTTDAYRLVEAP